MVLRVAAFILLSQVVWAQRKTYDTAHLVPRHAIRFSPFHLINFYPTIQVSYETRLYDSFTLQVEGGYVLPRSFEEADPFFFNKRGYKAKVEVRRYFWGGKRGWIFYGAPELYVNRVDFDRETTRTECFDQQCQSIFTRNYNYEVFYREKGIALKAGFVKYFSRFLLDVNTGWMVRVIRYDDDLKNKSGVDEYYAWFNVPNEKSRTAVSPVLGIRIGYRIR